MASITNEPNGRRTIQFVIEDGRRRSIRLGKVSKRYAESVRARIEELQAAKKTGLPISTDLKAWLDQVSDQLHDRLTSAELVPERHRQGIEDFIYDYIESRTDTKASTRTVYGRAGKHLTEHFGPARLVQSIKPADADAFRIELDRRGLSEATVRRTIGIAKQFFRAAVRAGLITENPFADLVSTVQANPAKAYFITREEFDKVIDAANDNEWRLLIALSRLGAFRVPSEPLALTWGDVDFERSRVRVPSPKTEHHRGKASRMMPLFPELRPYLDAIRPQEPKASDPVILRYRVPTVNLRTRLLKNIRRAGLEPWPKLWQNMRASRETELVETFPSHVVAEWVGHSVTIANKHYLQVTEDHFAKAVQKPVQHTHAGGGTNEKPKNADTCKSLICSKMQRGSR